MIKRFISFIALLLVLTSSSFSQRTIVSAANLFRGDSANIGTITGGSYTVGADGVWDWKKGDNVAMNITASSYTVSITNSAAGKEKILTLSASSAVTTLSWPATIRNVSVLPTSFSAGRVEVWKFVCVSDGIYAVSLGSSTLVDNTPPSKITNLVVNNPTTSGATFNFTAPSDNSGVLASYDVRVSTYPIAEAISGGSGGPPTYVGFGSGMGATRSIDSVRVAVDCGTGSQRGVIACVGWLDYSGVTITAVYNRTTGATLTKLGGDEYVGEYMNVEVWTGPAPNTGVNYITVKFSGNASDPGMIVSAWSNLNQTTPAGSYTIATGTSTTPSVTQTSSTSKIVMDLAFVSINAGTVSETVGASQTLITQVDNVGLNGDGWLASSYESGASSVVMSHTISASRPWISIAAELNGSAASDTVLWTNATPLVGEPVPKAPGQTESFVLGGLSANTTYYARVKSADAAGNISDSSNQYSFTTPNTTTTPGTSQGYNGFPGGPIVSNGSTVYYLDSSRADNSGDGKSLATAKKTWAAIQALLGTDVNYDTVLVRTGTYSEVMRFDRGGWSASHHVVVMRYGSDKVIFEGANDNLVPVFDTQYYNYITVQGIKFRDNEFTERRYSDGSSAYVMEFRGSSYVNMKWCYIVTPADSAELLYGGYTQAQAVTWRTTGTGTYVPERSHSRGIVIAGTWVLLEDCYIRGFDINIVIAGDPPPTGQNIIIRRDTSVCALWSNLNIGTHSTPSVTYPRRLLVEYCRFDTSWAEDNIQTEHYPQNPGGYNPENNKGVIIRYCDLGFAGENNIDLKGSSELFFYGNRLWGSFGDDDGPWYNGMSGFTGTAVERGWFNATNGDASPRHVVVRHNIVTDGNGGITTGDMYQVVNNTVLNMRFNVNGHNQTSGLMHGMQLYGDTRVKAVLNNIVANVTDQFMRMESPQTSVYFNNNAYYDTTTVGNMMKFYARYLNGTTDELINGLDAWKTILRDNTRGYYTNFVGKEANSQEARPVFVSNTTTPISNQVYTYDFTPASGSPLLGGGTTVTFTKNSGANSTNLTVDNPLVFHGEWSGVTVGDYIYVGSNTAGQRARIVTVDWTTGAITLDQPLTSWIAGDPVHWADTPSYNNKPNIGAK